jgi:hypothetical protein
MGAWTQFPDLDEVLRGLLDDVRRILGEDFVGMYLQGSFALRAGDAYSDADFLVVTRTLPSGDAEQQLRQLHDEIPTRPGIWNRNIEGSYADAASLKTAAGMGTQWLFNDHGHRTLRWDDHCNNLHTRWILRSHGIVLDGPPVEEVVDPVDEQALRTAAREALPHVVEGVREWAPMDHAWTPRYLVQTCCRVLYTATTGQVASKPQALTWAEGVLEPTWWPLLRAVAAERATPWQPVDPPAPGRLDEALAFAAHVAALTPA